MASLPPASLRRARLCLEKRQGLLRERREQRKATSSLRAGGGGVPVESNLIESKQALQKLVNETRRGAHVTGELRGLIEERIVEVERLGQGACMGGILDKIEGRWKLLYTSARDVLVLFTAEELLPKGGIEIGSVYQCFEKTDERGGNVKNIVNFSAPGLLGNGEGGKLCVCASYSVKSDTVIDLTFEEAIIEDVKINNVVEALIAPAILNRGYAMNILQELAGFSLKVPLRTLGPLDGLRRASSGGIGYQLTFCDEDLLLGKQIGTGGCFIFSKVFYIGYNRVIS